MADKINLVLTTAAFDALRAQVGADSAASTYLNGLARDKADGRVRIPLESAAADVPWNELAEAANTAALSADSSIASELSFVYTLLRRAAEQVTALTGGNSSTTLSRTATRFADAPPALSIAATTDASTAPVADPLLAAYHAYQREGVMRLWTREPNAALFSATHRPLFLDGLQGAELEIGRPDWQRAMLQREFAWLGDLADQTNRDGNLPLIPAEYFEYLLGQAHRLGLPNPLSTPTGWAIWERLGAQSGVAESAPPFEIPDTLLTYLEDLEEKNDPGEIIVARFRDLLGYYFPANEEIRNDGFPALSWAIFELRRFYPWLSEVEIRLELLGNRFMRRQLLRPDVDTPSFSELRQINLRDLAGLVPSNLPTPLPLVLQELENGYRWGLTRSRTANIPPYDDEENLGMWSDIISLIRSAAETSPWNPFQLDPTENGEWDLWPLYAQYPLNLGSILAAMRQLSGNSDTSLNDWLSAVARGLVQIPLPNGQVSVDISFPEFVSRFAQMVQTYGGTVPISSVELQYPARSRPHPTGLLFSFDSVAALLTSYDRSGTLVDRHKTGGWIPARTVAELARDSYQTANSTQEVEPTLLLHAADSDLASELRKTFTEMGGLCFDPAQQMAFNTLLDTARQLQDPTLSEAIATVSQWLDRAKAPLAREDIAPGNAKLLLVPQNLHELRVLRQLIDAIPARHVQDGHIDGVNTNILRHLDRVLPTDAAVLKAYSPSTSTPSSRPSGHGLRDMPVFGSSGIGGLTVVGEPSGSTPSSGNGEPSASAVGTIWTGLQNFLPEASGAIRLEPEGNTVRLVRTAPAEPANNGYGHLVYRLTPEELESRLQVAREQGFAPGDIDALRDRLMQLVSAADAGDAASETVLQQLLSENPEDWGNGFAALASRNEANGAPIGIPGKVVLTNTGTPLRVWTSRGAPAMPMRR